MTIDKVAETIIGLDKTKETRGRSVRIKKDIVQGSQLGELRRDESHSF